MKQSKRESKNYQILQSSQDKLFEKRQQSKSSKDNTQIFSEDDKDSFPNEKTASEKYEFSENDQGDDLIRQYILDLTLTIVDEVVKRSESYKETSQEHSSSRTTIRVEREENEKGQKLPEYFQKLGATQHHAIVDSEHAGLRKKSF